MVEPVARPRVNEVQTFRGVSLIAPGSLRTTTTPPRRTPTAAAHSSRRNTASSRVFKAPGSVFIDQRSRVRASACVHLRRLPVLVLEEEETPWMSEERGVGRESKQISNGRVDEGILQSQGGSRGGGGENQAGSDRSRGDDEGWSDVCGHEDHGWSDNSRR